jgi:hypothetical protein
MFTVTKNQPNRIEIEVNGGIDANIMTAGLDEMFRLSEGVENGTMLYTITELDMPTMGAVGVEIARLSKLFHLLGKYDKCAVLSDHSWIRTAAELEGALIPHFEMKSFHMDERSAAEAWLDV